MSENFFFITISPERMPLDFINMKFEDLSLKTSKYILDENIKKELEGLKSKNKITVKKILLNIVGSFKFPAMENCYYIKEIPIELDNKGKEEKIVIKFSKLNLEKSYDLSIYDDIKEMIAKNIHYYQVYIDNERRIYGIGDIKYLFQGDNGDLETFKNKLDEVEKKFFLTIPSFTRVYNSFQVQKEILSRHILIIGETGSGKTYSVIFPILDELKKKLGTFSALIIDPKMNELQNRFTTGLANKKYIIDILKSRKKIDVFEGMRDENIAIKMEFLFKISPRFNKQSKKTNDAFWPNAAKILLTHLVIIDEYLIATKDSNIFKIFENLSDLKFEENETYFSKIKKIINFMTESVYGEVQSQDSHPISDDSANKTTEEFEKEISDMVDQLKKNQPIVNIQNKLKKLGIPQIPFWGKTANDTFSSITSVAQSFLEDWTNPIIEKVLWSNPINKPNNSLSIEKSIKRKKILFFKIPDSNISEDHYRLGRIIKSKYFSFSFSTYNYRKKHSIQLFYIADEFHRFITGDEESGEQSFFDRCRAYNVSCIVATQSISSLRYGLQENTEDSDSLESSLKIILVNLGTKFFFRTTDINTNKELQELIPVNPYPTNQNLRHVLDVYPLTMLSTGTCYFLTPNGTWGRTKILVQ